MHRLVRGLTVIAVGASLGCNAQAQPGGRSSFQTTFSGKNEDWTILCLELNAPDHQNRCEQVADVLRRTPDIRPQEVRCETDNIHHVSRLFYGNYVRRVDSRSGKRSTPSQLVYDQNLIHDLADDHGQRFFVQARIIPVARPFAGPPEWSLANVRGEYSLQVAVFYPEMGFKDSQRAAVDYVKELRDQGFEAFYHHGASMSIVTIGVFDHSAVILNSDNTQSYSPEVRRLMRLEQFKYNIENGKIVTKTLENGRQLKPNSFLVRIPSDGQFGSS